MSRFVKDFAGAVLGSVGNVMFGMDEIIRLSLVALYTGGHVLLEGNPGLGKTDLVKTIGSILQLPFGRIQFTPDLMPADITGTFMPDLSKSGSKKLAFQPGPVFTSLLLADEINRATPKTQSAMLEAMAEKQVTVLGRKMKLAVPFMVLATQNPIDNEGTYNLPEAQADRFMFKAMMPVPGAETVRYIMGKRAGITSKKTDKTVNEVQESLLPEDKDTSKKKYVKLREIITNITPLPSLETHILNIFLASNRRFDELEDLSKRQVETVKRLVEELLTYGLGPRAAIALMLGAKAWSVMFLPNADNAEGPALGRIVIPVLLHRVKPDLDWEYRYRSLIKTDEKDDTGLFERMLADFCLSTAPAVPGAGDYQATFRHGLRSALDEYGIKIKKGSTLCPL